MSQKVSLEQSEKKVALNATTDSRYDFDEIVVFCGNKSVQIEVSTNFHSTEHLLFFADKAQHFKAEGFYHNLLFGGKSAFEASKNSALARQVGTSQSEKRRRF